MVRARDWGVGQLCGIVEGFVGLETKRRRRDIKFDAAQTTQSGFLKVQLAKRQGSRRLGFIRLGQSAVVVIDHGAAA